LPSIQDNTDPNNFTENMSSVELCCDGTRLPVQSMTIPAAEKGTTDDDCPRVSHMMLSESRYPHSIAANSNSVTLCIMLPNCNRIEGKFDYKKDRIKDVIDFAHCSMTGGVDATLKKMKNVRLSDNNVPVNVFSDPFLTLYEAGLVHNTLLHFSTTMS
jgi:hypothetical protein